MIHWRLWKGRLISGGPDPIHAGEKRSWNASRRFLRAGAGETRFPSNRIARGIPYAEFLASSVRKWNMTTPETSSTRPSESETGPKTESMASPPSAAREKKASLSGGDARENPSGNPTKAAGPAKPAPDDPDAPLDIPWKGVIIFLVLAWAFFRFSWLIFEIAG